jgi:hypothetical protein
MNYDKVRQWLVAGLFSPNSQFLSPIRLTATIIEVLLKMAFYTHDPVTSQILFLDVLLGKNIKCYEYNVDDYIQLFT